VSNNFPAHIQGENVKILANKISLRIIEGGKGLRLAICFVIGNSFTKQGFGLCCGTPILSICLTCNQKKNEYPYKNFPHHISPPFFIDLLCCLFWK
jgi:hypothetical protein